MAKRQKPSKPKPATSELVKNDPPTWTLPTVKFHIRIANQLAEIQLDACPRCHGAHSQLIATPFKNPSQYNFHSICPTTKEPIVLCLNRVTA